MAEEETKKRKTKKSFPTEVKISVKASREKQCENLVVLDLRGISSFTDFFVIMHGNSRRQNIAINENIEKELKKGNIRPLSIEGKEHAEWILMDYGSFIVHVFSEQAREYYSLEKLWGDAPRFLY